jgi:hypothetical protein
VADGVVVPEPTRKVSQPGAWRAIIGRVARLIRPYVLAVLGFGFLSAAAFVWLGLAAGLAATGVSCLVLEWRVGG